MGGDEAILIEHSYLNVSESVTAVYIPYIAAHVFQLKVPGGTGGTPGGASHPRPQCSCACASAVPRRAARRGAGGGARAGRPPSFIPPGWRRAGRAGA
jgi:hypothetical protein